MNLQIIPTDDIIRELESRFDVFIVAGVASITKEKDKYYSRYKGGMTNAIGLAEWLKTKIKRDYFETQEEGGDDV
ncbi:MAG: hypothetical protein DRH12_11855 [Deltaproteobacteria bacterium]|nr:MAG: hypothetical protein DRH12_11855 [Deltaproteobacteria bacterium]